MQSNKNKKRMIKMELKKNPADLAQLHLMMSLFSFMEEGCPYSIWTGK